MLKLVQIGYKRVKTYGVVCFDSSLVSFVIRRSWPPDRTEACFFRLRQDNRTKFKEPPARAPDLWRVPRFTRRDLRQLQCTVSSMINLEERKNQGTDLISGGKASIRKVDQINIAGDNTCGLLIFFVMSRRLKDRL